MKIPLPKGELPLSWVEKLWCHLVNYENFFLNENEIHFFLSPVCKFLTSVLTGCFFIEVRIRPYLLLFLRYFQVFLLLIRVLYCGRSWFFLWFTNLMFSWLDDYIPSVLSFFPFFPYYHDTLSGNIFVTFSCA